MDPVLRRLGPKFDGTKCLFSCLILWEFSGNWTCFRKDWLYPLSGKPEENRRRGRAWLKELTFSLSAEEKHCSLIRHPEAGREAAGELFCLFDMNFHVLNFWKIIFVNTLFFSQPKRICTSPYFYTLKWRRDGVKDGRIIFMVTENIKREEQNHGKMHDRKREFGERIEKNNLIFSKKFDCFMVQSAKNRMGMGVCELFCMCRKNRKKVLTSRG